MDYDNEDSIPHSRLAFTVLASVDMPIPQLQHEGLLFFKALVEQKSSTEKPTPCQEKANQLYDCCSHQLRFGVPPPECPERQ
jgi:hypothetical protein